MVRIQAASTYVRPHIVLATNEACGPNIQKVNVDILDNSDRCHVHPGLR